MSISLKRGVCTAVVILFGFAVGRAASFRFREKEEAIRKAFREELQTLGASKEALKAKYFTPEIHMVSQGCLLPGAAGEVVVKGKFAPGTRFVFENDNLEVAKESLVGGEYRATVKAAPGIGPQSAALMAITPVNLKSATYPNAVTVGGRYEWLMESGNGWKIVARSAAATPCAARSSSGDPYEVLFYRQGETQPFEKMKGTLYFSMYERTNFQFSLERLTGNEAGMQNGQALMEKLRDPKLTPAQRQQIVQEIQKAQAQMMANLRRMTDPAYIKEQEAKRLEFGCERIALEVQAAGFKGDMRCSQKAGARIPVTGTMKPL
jgi:hypothetical protein